MAKASAPPVSSPQSQPATVPVSFEAALAELETIVQAMESGEAPLEVSLAAYARGMALLKHCQDTLSAAEQTLQIIENGAPRNFDADIGSSGT